MISLAPWAIADLQEVGGDGSSEPDWVQDTRARGHTFADKVPNFTRNSCAYGCGTQSY